MLTYRDVAEVFNRYSFGEVIKKASNDIINDRTGDEPEWQKAIIGKVWSTIQAYFANAPIEFEDIEDFASICYHGMASRNGDPEFEHNITETVWNPPSNVVEHGWNHYFGRILVSLYHFTLNWFSRLLKDSYHYITQDTQNMGEAKEKNEGQQVLEELAAIPDVHEKLVDSFISQLREKLPDNNPTLKNEFIRIWAQRLRDYDSSEKTLSLSAIANEIYNHAENDADFAAQITSHGKPATIRNLQQIIDFLKNNYWNLVRGDLAKMIKKALISVGYDKADELDLETAVKLFLYPKKYENSDAWEAKKYNETLRRRRKFSSVSVLLRIAKLLSTVR